MLEARKSSSWRNRYEISIAGRVVTTWDSTVWRNGGKFELEGWEYQVRGGAWGNRFDMVDARGALVASANRVGRKRWTVEAAGQVYQFQRRSVWSNDQELVAGGRPIGSIRRTSVWRHGLAADLPGLPLPVQIFVVGVVLKMWEQQATVAAAGAGGA